jgi:hypothetical protein
MKEYREVLTELKGRIILRIEEEKGYGHWVITTDRVVFDLWFDDMGEEQLELRERKGQ